MNTQAIQERIQEVVDSMSDGPWVDYNQNSFCLDGNFLPQELEKLLVAIGYWPKEVESVEITVPLGWEMTCCGDVIHHEDK